MSQEQPPSDWREQRRQERAQRRAGRRGGYGGLIIATILIVAGLGVFFPNLPWQVFWGGLLILLGVWIAFAWTMRGRSGPAQPTQTQTG